MFNNTFRFIFFVFFVLILSEHVGFELWPQVYYFQREWEGVNLLTINPMEHPHLIRYLVVLPIFIVSDYLPVNPDFVFSLLCVFIIYVLSFNVTKITTYTFFLKDKKYDVLMLVSLVYFLFVSSFMNGRILFAMLGFSLIVLNTIKWELNVIPTYKMFSYNILGYFLCSVSSGTFLVSITFTFFWIIFQFYRSKSLDIYILHLVALIVFSPLIYTSIMNNVNFFGGGVNGAVNMLTHGFGIVFHLYDGKQFFLIIVFSAVICLFLSWLFKSFIYLRILFLATYTSMFGGAFGFSTLAICAPIVISLLLVFIFTIYEQFRYRAIRPDNKYTV
ncbi:hypothetical protein HWV00_17415 [Moritella sp. 24]|uniref:hypothetical protein n=1 Tax=Moritella sp. 24 TaxID=2746230 RepID=UPI001BA81AF0|nr:hypothetical protein [Moritella sp. 24]QUM77860.1 hypothetical protein HWV00_17415 [Moritella sp. 24]